MLLAYHKGNIRETKLIRVNQISQTTWRTNDNILKHTILNRHLID